MILLRIGNASVSAACLAASRQEAGRPRNRFMEIRIFGRVDDVDAARDDRNGAAGEGAVMRRSVDTARQPRDNDIALAAEVLGQRLCKPLRVD